MSVSNPSGQYHGTRRELNRKTFVKRQVRQKSFFILAGYILRGLPQNRAWQKGKHHETRQNPQASQKIKTQEYSSHPGKTEAAVRPYGRRRSCRDFIHQFLFSADAAEFPCADALDHRFCGYPGLCSAGPSHLRPGMSGI